MGPNFLFFEGVPSSRRRPVALERSPQPVRSAQLPAVQSDVFFHELLGRAGLKADYYRDNALQRRIPACLRFLRVADLAAARSKLAQRPELIAPTVDVVLLGVTDFCRDPLVFECLQEKAVPQLRRLDRAARIWSAACSDGRELYSVAILLHAAGIMDAELLGTDCRTAAIRLARAGVFPAESLTKAPAAWRRYFEPTATGMRIKDSLQQNVRWKQADLLAGAEPGPWDLILWRNMAIYLNPAAAAHAWQALLAELAPNGILVCGKADHLPHAAELQRLGPGIYQRK